MAAAETLTHIAVVGGTLADWAAVGDLRRWQARANEFAKVADHAGARWLTIRPMAPGPAGGASFDIPGAAQVGGCVVTLDPRPDGRQRLAEAVASIRGPLDEAAITAALNAPAPCDPDLMLIASPANVLPMSMVWELAYCELVYVDVAWDALSGDHLEQAINTFAARHRRFGGI